MGKTSRDKGARAERAAVDWFRVRGFSTARRRLAGDGRQGRDLDGTGELYVEVKDRARWGKADVASWLEIARDQCANVELPILLLKLEGRPLPTDWAVVMTAGDFMDFYQWAQRNVFPEEHHDASGR